MRKQGILCLDVGGTHLRIGLVDRKYQVHSYGLHSTPDDSGGGFLSNLATIINRFREDSPLEIVAVALGLAAAIDRARTVVLQAPNIPGLDGQRVVAQLEKCLKLPVFLAKDADLLLSYDLMTMALPRKDLTVGIYFGTGIGNSIYWNGRFLTGRNGVAGELGHIPQLGNATPCGCGNLGCLEPLGGGLQLQQLRRTHFPDTPISQLYACHRDTDPVRRQVDAMAVAVATEVNLLDPDHVIIGGGLPSMLDFPKDDFLERILLHTRKPLPAQTLDILFSNDDPDKGVLGAAAYGWDRLKRKRRE